MNAMFFGMPLALFPAIARGLRRRRGARAAVRRARGGRGRRRARERMDAPRAPPRARRRLRRGGLGLAIVGFGLADALWLALVLLALAGGDGRDQRRVPQDDLERDDPGRTCAGGWRGSR